MKNIIKYLSLILLILQFSLQAKPLLEKVSIQLNWKYQFEYAGFIMAKEKGFYENAGFEVELKEFTNSTRTIEDLINSRTTFATSDSLFMIERQTENLVLLANYLKQSPLVIATNKTVNHPRDLELKLFMSGEKRIINTPIYFMFKHLGMDLNKIQFKENTYDVQDLIDHNTDAMEVYRSNELYILKKKNIPYNIFDPKDYGFNSGAINMFTDQKNIQKYGHDKIEAFINATNKGWKYSLDNSDETIEVIYSKYNQSLQKSRDELQYEAAEIKKLFLLDQFKIGEINKQEIYRWFDILNNYGLLESQNKYDNFLFNQSWKETKYSNTEIYLIISLSSFIVVTMLIILYFSKSREKLLEMKNEQIKVQQQIFETLFNDSSDGILIIKDRRVHDCNKSIIQMLGFTEKKDLQKADILDISPQYQKEEELTVVKADEMLTITKRLGSHRFEWLFQRQDKTNFWADITLTSMRLDNDDVIHSVIRDISENKQLSKEIEEKKQQLFEQSKMAALGEMIGNIAHQWRQPLSAISTGITGLQVQKEYGMLSDEIFEHTCNAINENAQYLSKTIDDFRDFIKGEQIKKVFVLDKCLFHFLDLIDSSVKNHDIQIILNLEKEITINGYENELIQCFMNIFNNAKDALIESALEDKYIFIQTSLVGDNVVIKIKDNAQGIKESVVSKIFEPYFTTKHKRQGAGLGLHITYNLIVEGMNGTIEANNRSYCYGEKNYKGIEFTISLPMQ